MCPFQTKILVFCCTLPEPPSQLYLTPNSFPLGIILQRRLIIMNHLIPWQYQDPHPRPFTTTQTLSPYLTWLDNTNLCPCNKQIFGCDMSERPVENSTRHTSFVSSSRSNLQRQRKRKEAETRKMVRHAWWLSLLPVWLDFGLVGVVLLDPRPAVFRIESCMALWNCTGFCLLTRFLEGSAAFLHAHSYKF